MKLYIFFQDPVAEQFVGNILNYNKFCTSCDPYCDDCRLNFGTHADDILGVHQFPSDLPDMIEEPEKYLPSFIPDVDMFLVLGIHPDLLTGLPELAHKFNVKGMIVPVENGQWVPFGLQKQVEAELEDYGIQFAFPRPFCSLDKTGQRYIDEFIDYFKIGKPIVELEIRNNKFKNGRVIHTSPCGCMFYVVRQLIRFEETLDKIEEKISKYHHSYPCNASMNTDPVLKDTPLHVGGYIHRYAIYDAIWRSDKKLCKILKNMCSVSA